MERHEDNWNGQPLGIRKLEKTRLNVSHKALAKWQRMLSLPHESMAYGTLEDLDGEELAWDDLFVGPQNCAGASVEEDDEAYPAWWYRNILMTGIAQKMRVQIHSHVNMGVVPSSVDTALYNRIMEQLTAPDSFYIFIIMNKSYDYYAYKWNKDGSKEQVELYVDGMSLDDWSSSLLDNIQQRCAYTPHVRHTGRTPIKGKWTGTYSDYERSDWELSDRELSDRERSDYERSDWELSDWELSDQESAGNTDIFHDAPRYESEHAFESKVNKILRKKLEQALDIFE